jgi:large subunit ribosomal protein L29
MKATELREMSDEQLELTAVEAAETLFRLRLQSQTDRVDIPTQNKKNRRLIARVKTIQTQRSKVAGGLGCDDGFESLMSFLGKIHWITAGDMDQNRIRSDYGR